MFKKALSLLLALMLIVTSLSVTLISVAAAGDDEEPQEATTFVVAGSPADIFGTAWDATNADNTMTAQDDGTFTKTYTVTKAFTDVQVKAVKNGADWYGDETGNNVTFDLTEAGDFTVTATPVGDEGNYVVSVTGDFVKFNTTLEYDSIFAVGNGEGAWLNDASWDPGFLANEMTMTSPGIYEIEFEGVGEGFDRQVKFAIDGAWTHNFGGTFVDFDTETEAVYNGDNITFDTEEESQTVKLTLDLNEFNFQTKEGAKFTISIVTDDEEESSVAETTVPDEPGDETTAPDETKEGTQPVTNAETTGHEEMSTAGTTDAPSEDDVLKITAQSNLFPTTVSTYTQDDLDACDNLVTVTYFIQSDMQLVNADWLLTYDGDVLEFNLNDNMVGEGRDARVNIMPNAPDAVINDKPASVDYGIKGNCTNLTPYYLNDQDGDRTAFVTVSFRAKGTGDATVNLDVSEMRVTELPEGQTQSLPQNETQLVENGTVLDSDIDYLSATEVYTGPYDEDYEAPTEPPTTEEPTTEEPTTEEPTTEEPTTEEPTTEEPTTEEPAPEIKFVVAGSPADIFGTAWDAMNEVNLMTAQPDGTFTKTYTVDKAFTDVQLKAVDVNNNGWYGDATGNNVTFNLTGEGEFTVIATPTDDGKYVVSVEGDIVEFITTFDYDTVFAVGNGEGNWLNDGSWDPGFLANEMTEVADDLWEIEFTNVGEGFDRQIKFAIDGAWTHNFGGVFEDSGVETGAVYNGDNITFDTEFEAQTVKATLDLRDFNFATKEGAKFTITITEEGEAEVTTSPETTTEPPVEDTTVESTTVESTTTEPAPQGAFTVKATSNFFPETSNTYYNLTELEDENGDVFVTVEYKLLAENKYLINLDLDELTWDPSVLELKSEYNTYGTGRDKVDDIFPFAAENGFGGGVVDFFGDNNGGRITGNYTSVSPAAYAYNEDGSAVTVVKAVFKVLDRTAGETTVNCVMDTLSLCDDTLEEPRAQYVPVGNSQISDEDYDKASYSTLISPDGQEAPEETTVEETTVEDTTVEETTVEDTTVEETTVEDTTVEETTAPAPDVTFVVAGSPADIFGTAWDAANTDNTMTANDDGTFTKTYTVDKAFTDVQLKGVKNGADWYGDETGNNVTFNLTGAGEFTVTATPIEDGYVMSVAGDIVEFLTEFEYDTVFAVGNGEGTWLNDGSWDPAFAANEMTQTSENVWEIEFNNVGEGFDRQIKFAIDGAWTHNFGGAFEDSGVTSDAVYNGDNITFDTEYESQTVKAVLDLSEFDFSTKEGAKFTITITEEGAVEDTTAAETTVEPTTEEPADGLDVTGVSNYCPTFNARTVNVGDTVTINFAAPEDLTIVNLQWAVDYDDDMLELTGVETFTGQMLVNDNATSHDVIGNCSNIDGISFSEGQDFISLTFTAKAAGETEVALTVIDMSEKTENTDTPYYENGVNVREQPVEPTTEEPTTEEPTTEAPADKLTVSGTSNYCPAIEAQEVAVGESVTMNFVAPEDVDIVDIQWGLTYDKDLLELTNSEFFTGSMLANNNATSYNSMGNMTDINGVSVAKDDTIASFTFNVKAAAKAGEPTGKAGADVGAGTETAVDFNVIDMTVKTDDGDQIIIADSVDQRTPEEPTTEEPTTEEPTTEEPSTAEPTTERPEDSLGVSGVSNYCDAVEAQIVKNGETVTVTFKAPENVDIIDLQWSLDYDNDLLELTNIDTFTSDMLVNNSAESHDALGSVANVDNPYSVTQGDDFVSFTFTAKGAGDTQVEFNVIDMSVKTDEGEETYFVNGEDVRENPEEPTTEPETTEEPEPETTEEPTTEESTTEEPGTTEPGTTEAPDDKLVVTGSSNYCDSVDAQLVDPAETVTVTFKAPEDVDIINLQWALDYDNDLLEFVSVDTFTGDMSFNYSAESHDVMGSVSNLTPYSVSEGDTFVTATFTAKAPGTTEVTLTVIDMSVMTDDGEKVYFAGGDDVRDNPEEPTTEPETTEEPTTEEPTTEEPTTEEPTTEEPTTEEPTTEEPTTEEPTTEEPTTEEPAPETKFVVAGSPADIFGTNWDATNEDNLMTPNGDGSYSKTYTADKAYGSVQLKAVETNTNSWYGDENGDNVTFNITGPGDFTVTATPDGNGGYVVTVTGDNVQEITEFNYDTVFAVGNGEGTWLNGAAWAPDYAANEMTEVSDGIWEIEFTNVPDGFERQIKFAIDGAWTHNFGGSYAGNGVEGDAVYNGDNITFDTEDDSQTVKVQLDLRDFDFATKQGAKVTVTITPDTEPTTAEPTTVEPTTVEPTTVEPTTVESTTVPLTTEDEEEEEESYMVVFSDGSTAPLEKDENGNFVLNTPVDGEEEEIEFKIVKVNADGTQVDVTDMQSVAVSGNGSLAIVFNPDTNEVDAEFTPASDETTTVPEGTEPQDDEEPTDEPGTSSTDSTSSTTPVETTEPGGSISSPDSPGEDITPNSAVQTGNASMAIIILMILVSATAGIYFARKKQN